jgi:HAMP domain-containing protein
MKFPAQIQSFRARLLLLLALMLGLTLGIQYYFNLRTVRSNARMIIEQEQAIMTGIALGLESVQSDRYLVEIIGDLREPLLNDKNVRVKNILVVDDDGNVRDSVIPEYNPREREDNTTRYVQFKDIQLPPLRSVVQYTNEHEQLPSWIPPSTNVNFGEAGAFYFPVQTTQGRRFIIVVLDSAPTTDVLERQSSRSALYTLAVLFVTTLVTGFFVWRFTRPVKELSTAARKVAGGNFDVQVPAGRRDEMGTLASAFNEMTGKLARARELEMQLHQARSLVVWPPQSHTKYATRSTTST